MSLLLDALKDADHRHREQAGTRPGRPAESTPPVDDAVALSILEDSRPKPGLAAAQSAAPKAAETPIRQKARRESSPPPRRSMRRVLAPAALVLLSAALGAAYLWLDNRNTIEPLLTPPSAAVSASVSAPDESPPSLGTAAPAAAPATPHFLPAPRLDATARTPVQEASPPQQLAAVAIAPQSRPAAPPPETARIERSLSPQESPSLQAAYQALRSGELTRAESLYTEVLRAQPHQVDAHLGLAALATARGDRSTALSHYRQVLDLVPDHPRAWSGLAELSGKESVEILESRLRNLIASRPDASLHFALGNLLARQSRWVEAQESYFNASTAAPDNADYTFNLAVALDHLAKAEAAATHYDTALQLAVAGSPVQFSRDAVRDRLAALRGSPR